MMVVIVGRVVEKFSERPLPYVTIIVTKHREPDFYMRELSDEFGFFKINVPKRGVYFLRFKKSGYNDVFVRVKVEGLVPFFVVKMEVNPDLNVYEFSDLQKERFIFIPL